MEFPDMTPIVTDGAPFVGGTMIAALTVPIL